jgi:hypothetical protein
MEKTVLAPSTSVLDVTQFSQSLENVFFQNDLFAASRFTKLLGIREVRL